MYVALVRYDLIEVEGLVLHHPRSFLVFFSVFVLVFGESRKGEREVGAFLPFFFAFFISPL